MLNGRVEGFVTARQADKLALREVKVSYLTTIASMQIEWPRAAADLKLPLFIGVAGKDRIVDSRAARRGLRLRRHAAARQDLAAMGRRLPHALLGPAHAGDRGRAGKLGPGIG